jgi:hypothetical protein
VLSLLGTAKAAVSNDAALRGVDRRALHVVKLSLLERARDERLGKEGERPAQQDDSDLREQMLPKVPKTHSSMVSGLRKMRTLPFVKPNSSASS